MRGGMWWRVAAYHGKDDMYFVVGRGRIVQRGRSTAARFRRLLPVLVNSLHQVPSNRS